MLYGPSDVGTDSKHVVLVRDSLWTTVGDEAVNCLIHACWEKMRKTTAALDQRC